MYSRKNRSALILAATLGTCVAAAMIHVSVSPDPEGHTGEAADPAGQFMTGFSLPR